MHLINYLLDNDFLLQINNQQYKIFYAKIIALNINNDMVDTIQGRVTGGSISLDGSSAVRRTCNISMVAAEANISDYAWGLKTRFKLEIGIANLLENQYSSATKQYPDIVWFPMGHYIISSFNTSINPNGINVSISGKDKMCMLNGELGGSLFASIDFGSEETFENKMRKIEMNFENSDILMQKVYYILVSSAEDTDLNQEYIYEKDPQGLWFLLNGEYIYDKNKEKLGNHFNKYRKVQNPQDCFEQINTTEKNYEPSKYFICKKEDSQYYELEIRSSNEGWPSSGPYFQHKELYELEQSYSIKKIPLEKIIREAVHAFGLEPYHNIIISNLEKYGLEQVSWRGEKPLIVLRNKSTGHFTDIRTEDKFKVYETSEDDAQEIDFLEEDWDRLVSDSMGEFGTVIKLDQKHHRYIKFADDEDAETDAKYLYTAAKITQGEDIGYRITDLVYTGDLISSIGENLTSILDKIKNMLGDFEYFYDIDGRFIFQEKPLYVNSDWSTKLSSFVSNEDERYVTYANDLNKYSFSFEGNNLITSFQNTPQLSNLKNDFIVWGKRKGIDGIDVPIHARYAIDKKPQYYESLNGKIYATSKQALYNNCAQLQEIRKKIQNFSLESNIDVESYIDNINSFSLKYPLPDQAKTDLKNDLLVAPTQNPDGSWTTGWWEIRDWADYYNRLTGITPSQLGTLAFYSQNDPNTGAIEVTFPNGSKKWLVWLLTIDKKKNGTFGYSNRHNVQGRDTELWHYYKSENYTSTGSLDVERVPGITREMVSPFNGCLETHTYYHFLQEIESTSENIEKRYVYFYNPRFPLDDNEEEIIQTIFEYRTLLNSISFSIVDWREIIYQMALDYFAAQGCSETEPLYISDGIMYSPDDFLAEVKKRNPTLYPTGYTGYEQYYTDIQGFWRELYNPDYSPKIKYENGYYENIAIKNESSGFYTRTHQWKESQIKEIEEKYFNAENGELAGWNKNIFFNPENLNFWFDFLDQGDELAALSISKMGDRQKVVHDDKISAIVFKDVPDLILFDKHPNNDITQIPTREMLESQTGYTWIYIPKGFNQYLNTSFRSLSAKNKIDELVYQFAYCIDNISLTAIPIYSLQPNTVIHVFDQNSKINGEYIVSRINYSLNYNGTMNITASKAPTLQIQQSVASNSSDSKSFYTMGQPYPPITIGKLMEKTVYIKDGNQFRPVNDIEFNTSIAVPNKNAEEIPEDALYTEVGKNYIDDVTYTIYMQDTSYNNIDEANILKQKTILGIEGILESSEDLMDVSKKPVTTTKN